MWWVEPVQDVGNHWSFEVLYKRNVHPAIKTLLWIKRTFCEVIIEFWSLLPLLFIIIGQDMSRYEWILTAKTKRVRFAAFHGLKS